VRRDLPLLLSPTVLFPGDKSLLSLQGNRERAMVEGCLRGDGYLGVVFVRQWKEVMEPCEVGTVARILHVEASADERLNVVVRGEQRFRIVEMLQYEPYPMARVELLPNRFGTISTELTRIANRLAALLYRYLELKAIADRLALADLMLPTDLAALGFRIGALLDLPLREKQRLLETEDLTELLQCELDILSREIRRLQRATVWRELLQTDAARRRRIPPDLAVWN
jgi:Lon protease-like protein